jgi:cell division protein ZipA
MDNLRWALLALGILVVAGIYLWEMRRRRRRGSENLDDLDLELLQSLDIRRDRGDGAGSLDLDDLEDIEPLRGGRRSAEERLDVDDLKAVVPRDEERPRDLDLGQGAIRARERESRVYTVEPRSAQPGQELIIVLNVMAEPGQAFAGEEVRDALGAVGMRYGDMQIYHHHGVGKVPARHPVFSAANILEPGILDPEHLEQMSTPGLCLFMRLPGAVDGPVAFELMLNTGQRLADLLHGELRDHTRSVLDPEAIAGLRARVAEFSRQPAG